MSYLSYLKERWLTYLFLLVAAGFSMAVFVLDPQLGKGTTSQYYIFVGCGLFTLCFTLLDYSILRRRMKAINEYSILRAPEEADHFHYPMDKSFAKALQELVWEFESYKGDIRTQTTEEMEYITKWLHDIKVPIAALRLIGESHADQLPPGFYQGMDRELQHIEASIQQVFFSMKAKSFHEDYKLVRVETKRLIAQALKGFASFFSYKQIQMSLEGESYQVLTDEKWSGYILSQLISNAVKYTPQGGKIQIKTLKEGDQVSIVIYNEGQGILPKDINQIFQKGYTASENRQGAKATGYGLYLSKRLSDLLGHRLTATSEYGVYAQFTLTFQDQETLYSVTKL